MLPPRPHRLFAGAFATVALLAGCSSTALHGQSRLEATYSGRDLKALLPVDVSIAEAAAAAEAALRAGGYVITERTVAADRARLVGQAPDREGLGPESRPVVVIEPVASGARTIITLEPFGAEEASRRILDRMVALLGL